jgi:PAS domain S-box-containing protein
MKHFGQYARRQMAFPQVTRPRLLAALLLAAGVALLGLALKNNFASTSYDLLHSLAGVQSAATADSPVVIVYLDLASFLHEHQDPAQPWPRELHAQLLRRLTRAGAKTVVFDIVFGNAGPSPEADKSFAAAIRENGRVILAAEFNSTTVAPDDQHNWARFSKVEPLYAPFVEAAAVHGIASQGIDDDNVVRRYVAGFNSDPQSTLTWAAASWLHLPVTQTADALAVANQKWVRYYGPPLTIPHISYSQVLETNGVTDDFFRDKIVFVGARPQVELFNESKDEFRNPFHSWQYKNYFMPGVEVHATEMLNLIRNDGLQRASNMSENFLLLAVALMFGGGLIWLRPLPATVVALAGAALAPVLARAGFAQGFWFPWLVVSAVQIPAALFGSWMYQFQDWFFTRRKLEAAKKIADAKIREQAALIDKAHDAILVQDLAGKIIYANPSAEKIYGWKLSELKPDSAAELFSPAPAVTEKARADALADGEWNGELQLQTRAGQVITVDSRWTLIRDDAGRPSGLLLINSDITEKKSLEQQFLRTQRMNTIGTLAGGMAHDLNNALSPVLLGAQLLRRKSGDADDRKMLAMIETSANRGADMVRQVLLFARGRGGEFERLELGPLVRELEKMVRETFPRNISVETFLPRDLWLAQGNPTQLHQVLLNLCVNARDAMPDGGKLSFVADNVELTGAEAADIPDGKAGKFVSVSVSDTGTGMPPEVEAKIFEPFFTTKGEGKGTGIGLATVVRILKSHGGFLRVESEVGEGTVFEIFIPCAGEITPAIFKPVETDLPRGQDELILLADDEQAICELVAGELKEFGYRVLTATNGAEALTLFKQHAGEVRLIITDNSMPVMNGPQAIVEIRKLRPGIPAILSSGEAGLEGLDGVIQLDKPFAFAELLAAVSRSLK